MHHNVDAKWEMEISHAHNGIQNVNNPQGPFDAYASNKFWKQGARIFSMNSDLYLHNAHMCVMRVQQELFFQNLLKYALKNVSFQSWKHMKYNSNIQFADGFLVKLFNMYEYHLHIRWRSTPNQLQPVFWIHFFAFDHILNASFSEHNFT